ncbi:23083_t:CDS:2, partial [Cetraspora pellucida]
CYSSNLACLDLTTIKPITNSITIKCINPKETNIAIDYRINKKHTKKIFIAKTAIFLSNIGPYKLAAVDTITNWLKNIIRRLTPEEKAKDICILLAILAQNADMDLNSILALGNWSNLYIYQEFYQHGIKLMLEQNNITKKIMN